MVGYIYKTTNKINQKAYIGLHLSEKFDPTYFGSGKLLKKAIAKYGIENFEISILEWCETVQQLQDKEVEYLKLYNCKKSKNYYNLIDTKVPILFGEDNGFYGKKHTEESKNKMKEAERPPVSQTRKDQVSSQFKTLWQNNEYRIKMQNRNIPPRSEDSKKLISMKLTGRSLSEEHKQNLSLSLTGKSKGPLSEEHKSKISQSLKGKKKNQELVNKINKNPEKIKKTADAHRGMKRTDEAKSNMSAARKGKKYYHNPETLHVIFVREEDVPDGYIKGKISPKQ